MRRTTPATLLEQARIFTLHLTNSPEHALGHHAEEISRFLVFLHERTVVTHSVREDIPGPEFPSPEVLLGPGGAESAAGRVQRSKAAVARLFADLLDRRLRVALRPDARNIPA
jgi:hypothetical protein